MSRPADEQSHTAKPTKTAVLIVGMHRSGTSAMARVASLCGASLPARLMPPNLDNEAGFWEPVRIADFNDELLVRLGLSWDDVRETDLSALGAGEIEEIESRLAECLREDFADAQQIVLKEPRISRLLPLYERTLKSLGYRVCVIIMFRNPLAVVASLKARNGFEEAYAAELWKRYVIEAEFATRELPRVFVEFDSLLTNWRKIVDRGSRSLRLDWEMAIKGQPGVVDDFLNTAARHHFFPDSDLEAEPELYRPLAECMQAMRRFEQDPTSTEAMRLIDQASTGLSNELSGIGEVLGKEMHRRLMAAGEEKTKRDEELAGVWATLEAMRASVETYQSTKLELEQQLQNAQKTAEIQIADLSSQSRREIDALTAKLNWATEQHVASDAARIELMHELENLRATASDELVAARLHWEAEASASESKIRSMQSKNEALEHQLLCQRAQVAEHEHQTSVAKSDAEIMQRELQQISIQSIERATRDEIEITQLRHALAHVQNEYQRVMASTSWRVMSWPRLLIGSAPQPVRLGLRRTAKLAFWMVTPWRIPQRLRFMRKRAEQVEFADERPSNEAQQPDTTATASALLSASPLFDGDWYLNTYPDVAASDIDPVTHYLAVGAAEGRDPSPLFDTNAYLLRYRSVEAAGINPLHHYLEHGKAADLIISPSRLATTEQDDRPTLPQPTTTEAALSPLDRDALEVSGSDLFDRNWYIDTYHDVDQAGIDPVIHYLTCGAKEGRNPGPNFATRFYLERYPSVEAAGINPLIHYIRHGRADGLLTSPVPPAIHGLATIQQRFPDLRPLPIIRLPGSRRRVVMVTDSIGAGSFFGGVGTALILSALLAERLGVGLCIATRTEAAGIVDLANVLRIHGVPLPDHIEIVHAASNGMHNIPVHHDDLMITTSWWSTHATLRSVPAEQVVYIIQEDERMFYPHGDDHLLCSETISDTRLRYVVNSRLLFDHFASSGITSIGENGAWFEPSFPRQIYHWEESARTGKRQFTFYARPNNHRNLYFRGIELIDEAITSGLLDPQDWDFTLVGKDLSQIRLGHGIVPCLRQSMDWAEYAALIRRTDLGLSLMYTPHPSYPPLDIAACGGVALTNRFGNKASLDQYSQNILCADTDLPSLIDGLRWSIELVENTERRRCNYEQQAIGRDWRISFADILRDIAGE